jgi:hypothetical protein
VSSVKKTLVALVVLLTLFAAVAVPVFASPEDVTGDTLPVTSSSLFDSTKFVSNQYTQTDDETVVTPFIDIPSTFVKASEDDRLELWYEPGNYAIRIVDRTSGYIFGSSFADKTTDLPDFNRKFEGIINSAVVIEYYTYNASTGVYTSVEESMFQSDLTTTDFTAVAGGFDIAVHFGESGIGLVLQVTLEDGDLHLRIDNDSITEGEDMKLRSIKIYPYFGAVYGDSVPGYLLVPDGIGALVRYRAVDAVTDVYQLNYYGTDIGIKSDVADAAELTLPVFGMIHGIRQHGFLGIIEEGATDATLVVNPAKNNLKYYYSHPLFVYRSQYASPTSKAAAAAGTGTQVIQSERNSFDIHLVYRFLDGEEADYVGMANSYRDHLIEAGTLTPITGEAPADLPTHVEIIGAERTSGFLFDRTVVATDFSQATAILTELTTTVGPIHAVYKGALKGGYSGAGPVTSALESALGTTSQYLELSDLLAAAGGSLSLYADPLLIYDAAPHSLYKDVAQRVNSNLLTGSALTMTTYFAAPVRAMELLADNADTWSARGIVALALGTVGNVLYSDFKDGTLDRAEAAKLYDDTLSGIGQDLSLYRPDAYLFDVLARYLAVPTVTKQYQIYTDTVPFLSIVLAGTVECYGGYLNFAADETLSLLKLADYDLYPAYVLTWESAYLLQDTELANVFSSSYATWKDRIAEDHEILDAVLLPAYGSAVASRRVIEPGFVRIAYANGTVVYVNYTASAKTDGLVSVAAREAMAVTADD